MLENEWLNFTLKWFDEGYSFDESVLKIALYFDNIKKKCI